MADPIILGLYALSRKIAGNKQREEEKKLNTPVTYVRVGNKTVEFDEDNPDHKGAMIVGTRIGDQLISEPERFKQAVRMPSGETVTIDEYKSRTMDRLEKEATSRDFGMSLSTDPSKISEELESRIIIPPVIGNISSRGNFTPTRTASTNKRDVVGKYFPEGFSGWMGFEEFAATYEGETPTLQGTLEGDASKPYGVKAYAGLTENGKNKSNFKIKSPNFTFKIQNKQGNTEDHTFSFGSTNGTNFGQLKDIHSTFGRYAHNFATLGVNDPQAVKFRNFLTPLLVEHSEIKEDRVEGDAPRINRNFVDASEALKQFPNFRDIPGMLPALAYGQSMISKKFFDKKIQSLSAPNDKNKTVQGTVKTSNALVNFDISYPKTYKDENDFEITASLIVNTVAPDEASQEEKNATLEPLIQYEYEVNTFGDVLRIKTTPDGLKIPKPAGEQHILKFINSLRTSKAATGNQFPVWLKLVHPRVYKDIKSSPTDEQAVKNNYGLAIASLPNGYQVGHNLIMLFQDKITQTADNTPLETKLYNSLSQQISISQKNQNDFYADSVNKRNYSATTIGLLKRYKGSYFRADGTPFDISYGLGEVIMTKDGLLYWADVIKNYAGKFLDADDEQNKKDNYFKPIRDTEGITSKGPLTEAGMLESISEKFYRRSDIGRSDALHAKRQRQMSQIAAELNDKDEYTRALAQRKYYRMMIAYQMAAAIQGGTGGRTISDQDVENILNALGGMGAFSTPEKELAGIDAALTLMQEIYQFNKHLSGSPKEKNAALKHQEFITEGNPNGILQSPMGLTGTQAALIIDQASGVGINIVGGEARKEQAKGITDANVLQFINNRQIANGQNPYKSVDEARKALGDKRFENQKLRIKRL